MDTSNILGTDHCGIYCEDREDSLRLYRDILGFRQLFSVDMPAPHNVNLTFIQKENLTIELLTPSGDKRGIIEGAAGTLNHIAIKVQHIDEVVTELFELGYEFENPEAICVPAHGVPPVSIKIAFFRGPGGERIELFEYI